jgi:two-component system, cell cycle sensor histidine kinase and response regulator CckA
MGTGNSITIDSGKSKASGKKSAGRALSLRKQAEARLRAWEEVQPKDREPEMDDLLVRNLRIHQIELEIQNEELRSFQEELATSQARYLDLYDFAPVGYLTVNQAGIILEANHTAAVLLGVAPGKLAKQPVYRFIFADDQDTYYLRHKASFATEEPQTCKVRLLRKGSKPFWARLESGSVREDGLGAKVCRMVIIDIGDGVRKAAEKIHLETQDRQLQKAESLGRMAGAIAHHFNNLLTVIMGNLELAANDVPGGSAIGEYLDAAMEASGRAAELSGSMLVYLGQTLGKHQPLDLSAICRATLSTLKAGMPREVKLKAVLPVPGPVVRASSHQIRRVLKNLLNNGWEALGERKGSVHLSVTTVNLADIPTSHRFPLDWKPQDCPYACLEVRDAGCGIAEKDIEKIFDPFFTQKFLGRGLGLPIVLGIVRAHYGVVTVASTVGSGSVVRVFLPVHSGGIAWPLEGEIQVAGASEGGSVLIIDDEPMLLEIAQCAPGRRMVAR